MSAVADEFQVRRAERRTTRLRVALAAASGGGKTASALLVAKGIVEEALARGLITGTLEGKIGVVDTERQSAELYSHLVPFDVVPLNKPYSVARYGHAMSALERAGVYVMILDSISHGWVGDGGVLALLNSLEAHERFSGFGTKVNPAQDEFVDRILRSPCHVIVTMRSKTAWVLEQVEKKRRDGSVYNTTAPRRIGMKPIQREGIEFEFTTLLDLDTGTHHATVIKNRCTVFDNWQPQKLTVETGRALLSWMQEGAPTPEEPVAGTPEERAEAVTAAAERAMERAATLPDLARVLGDADVAVREFSGSLGVEPVAALRKRLADAKDARKAALGGDRGAQRAIDTSVGDDPGPTNVGAGVMEEKITDDQETSLRAAMRESGVSIADCIAQFRIARIGDIRRVAFGECLGWIKAEGARRAGPRGARKPGGHFDDMKDDIPW